MIIPIVLLTVSLILTFGGTVSRLFDRLRISFKASVLLQFLLLAAAVLPHVTASSQKYLALCGVGLTAAAGGAYAVMRRTRLSLPHCLAGTACALTAEIGVYALGANYAVPEVWLTVLSGLYTGGIAFLFARSHSDAFAVCFFTQTLLFAAVFFSPLFFAFSQDAVTLSVRMVNGTVYGLFVALALMNLFKRIRRTYAENRENRA